MTRTACFFQYFEINNIAAVNASNIKKKYVRLYGSLGFSNATAPAASNGPATNKAKKSIKTNKQPIRKIGKTSVAFVFLFISPKEQKLPIYEYSFSRLININEAYSIIVHSQQVCQLIDGNGSSPETPPKMGTVLSQRAKWNLNPHHSSDDFRIFFFYIMPEIQPVSAKI
jgi:hypothetical protein